MSARLILATFFSFLMVAGSGSVACGDLLIAPSGGAMRMSRGSGVGPIVDSAKVERILGNLETRGVTVIRGERAAGVLDEIGAGAAYLPMFGKPRLYFGNQVTRGQLVEELLHHGQSLRRGHASPADTLIGKRILLQDEVAAQRYLIDHATRKGWTTAEVDFYKSQLGRWQSQLDTFNAANP